MGQNRDSELNDVAHERAIWKIQHFAWSFFGFVLLAAVAGAFGRGPISRAKANTAGLSIEYERFLRYQSSSKLKLQVGEAGTGNALPAVWLAREFVDRVEMEHVYPTPERVKVAEDRFIYIFNVAQTNANATVSFQFKPDNYGKTQARLGLLDGPEMTLGQFVYP